MWRDGGGTGSQVTAPWEKSGLRCLAQGYLGMDDELATLQLHVHTVICAGLAAPRTLQPSSQAIPMD